MRRILPMILGTLLLLSLCQTATAGQHNLTGQWTFAFTIENGASYADPCTIQQDGSQFSGAVIYEDDGNTIQEPFSGEVHDDGSVEFVLYDAGNAVHHQGRISPDGNTVHGTWSFSDGSGDFTLVRQ